MNMDIKKIDSITLDDIKKIASNCDSDTEIVLILCGANKLLEPEITSTMSTILYKLICHIKKIKYDITVMYGKTKNDFIPMKNGKNTTLSSIILCAGILRLVSNSKYGCLTE